MGPEKQHPTRTMHLECYVCSAHYALDDDRWKCSCGGALDVRGTPMFTQASLANRPPNFWRYREALGLPTDMAAVSLGEVMTPLLPITFREYKFTLKLEQYLPSGSYKDRGVAVCVTQMAAQEVNAVHEDSSGNAGASTAAYAARGGMRAEIYVPASASTSKINQIRMYGAKCRLVPGPRQQSTIEAQKPNEKSRYIGHSWSPFFACGVKSVAYEIAEQTNWDPPDWVVTPAGGGGLVLGMVDGFGDLLEAGYIKKIPKILAVQSALCAPIYDAWSNGATSVTRVSPQPTVAEGLALSDPSRGDQVLEAIRRNNGRMAKVTEQELMSVWSEMAGLGVFVEPTSAVAGAAAWQAKRDGTIGEDESVLVIITGHGLKAKDTIVQGALGDVTQKG